jgi:D-alanine-D-alanine ligase
MKVGIACDLKEAVALETGQPDDALEEYDSVETVEIIRASLEAAGHRVVMLGGGREFLDKVLNEPVDIVFNIAEGRGTSRSREAQVPAVLEMLGIPYSGSDPQCLAICLDKPVTKKLVTLAGVPTPRWIIISNEQELAGMGREKFPFPAIAKPAYEGSSKGVRATSLVHDYARAKSVVGGMLRDYHQPVMVEEFIDGDEVTVGITGNNPSEVLGTMRILPRQKNGYFVYSLEVKRDWKRLVDYESPARLAGETARKIKEYSLKAFETLECRDFSRLDFRVPDGVPYFIEINPLPGLGTYSDLIIMALKLGWTHQGVIQAVFNAALKRYPQILCM